MNKSEFFRVVVPKVKKILGIQDISMLRKKIKKNIGRILYHKKYSAGDIVDMMVSLGMKKGSVVCIHASMMEFYNYTGTAEELIESILREIGSGGTLLMPALPKTPPIPYEDFVFNPLTEKSDAGYLAEVFRKYPGVVRSNNVHHSVCAIGKYAQYLVKDHTSGDNCWDELSPWYKMCELDALVFNLGLPRSYMGTFHHCVEGILSKEKNFPYWSQFFSYKQKYNYLDVDGVVHTYINWEGDLVRKTHEKQVTRYFTPDDWRISRISNLEIKVFYAKNALQKMLDLGRHGISVYYIPSVKGFKFHSNEAKESSDNIWL